MMGGSKPCSFHDGWVTTPQFSLWVGQNPAVVMMGGSKRVFHDEFLSKTIWLSFGLYEVLFTQGFLRLLMGVGQNPAAVFIMGSIWGVVLTMGWFHPPTYAFWGNRLRSFCLVHVKRESRGWGVGTRVLTQPNHGFSFGCGSTAGFRRFESTFSIPFWTSKDEPHRRG